MAISVFIIVAILMLVHSKKNIPNSQLTNVVFPNLGSAAPHLSNSPFIFPKCSSIVTYFLINLFLSF